ncbi:MAG: NUDIX domain-containing protein [Candidatus Omnitrophota bacterium]
MTDKPYIKIHDVEIEIVQGDGENIPADAVALESLENFEVPRSERLVVSGNSRGAQHYTIMADFSFDGTLKDAEKIRSGYKDVLRKTAELKVRRLVLIPFGYQTGVITPSASAKVLAQELLRFIRFGRHCLESVSICVTDEEHFDDFEKNIIGYLLHVQDTLGMGPYVTVDAIVERPEGIIIIERSNPPYGWALPGGFVDYGESLETAVVREVKEETGLDFQDIVQLKTFSDPCRDPRFHTVSTAFVGRGDGKPQAMDDAKDLRVVSYDDLLKGEYAFDHKKIIALYLECRAVMSPA